MKMNRHASLRSSLGIAAGLILLLLGPAAEPARVEVGLDIGPAVKAEMTRRPRRDEAYGKLPLAFEINRGQAASVVEFMSRGPGYTLFLTPTEAVLTMTKGASRPRRESHRLPKPVVARPDGAIPTVVKMKLVGANPKPKVIGREKLPGTVNYFIGNDPKKWRTNVPTYARVEYQNVYPGINMVYYGNQRQLEYDFVVAPGADPRRIRLAFEGVDKLDLDARGNLMLRTAHGEMLQRAPVIYQDVAGAKREISGRYVVKGKNRVIFQVAAYDVNRPLIIDPVLVYSTYLGGSAGEAALGLRQRLRRGIHPLGRLPRRKSISGQSQGLLGRLCLEDQCLWLSGLLDLPRREQGRPDR